MKIGVRGPVKTVAAIRSYITAFLDASFWGQPLDPVLTALSSEYLDVVVTRVYSYSATKRFMSSPPHIIEHNGIRDLGMESME